MSLCPGKRQSGARSGVWARDLGLDIDAIRAWGAAAVVTLMEMHEHNELGVQDLPEEIWGAEMEWFHLPIVDQRAPDAAFMQRWDTYGGRIVSALASGEKIFIHCKGGLGRTGTIAACLLIESGMKPDDAIAAVRKARRGTIETLEQERFVLGYTPHFR